MKTARSTEAPTGRLKMTTTSTKKMPAAASPLKIAPFQVGGFGPAGARLLAPALALARASARLRGRPLVRRSILPAWVPRCFLFRLRFDLATAGNLDQKTLDYLAVGIESFDREVFRISLECRMWCQADQLRRDHLGAM